MKLFRRNVRVTIVGLPPDKFAPGPPTNAMTIDAMRIRFHVKKNLGKHPNKCVIKLTNLAPVTRSLLVKPLRVILHAGFDRSFKLVFDGDLERATPMTEGKADVVTELHVGDGARASKFAPLRRSYSPPFTPLAVIRDVCQSMGTQVPPEIFRDPRLTQASGDGFSSSSTAGEALTAVTERLGYSWSFQDRQLVILSDSQVREGQEYVISQATGLIHSPKFKEGHQAGGGKKTEVTFETLLFPELLPGSACRIESEFLRQRAKLTDVTHQGDSISGGEDFTTEAVGKPL